MHRSISQDYELVLTRPNACLNEGPHYPSSTTLEPLSVGATLRRSPSARKNCRPPPAIRCRVSFHPPTSPRPRADQAAEAWQAFRRRFFPPRLATLRWDESAGPCLSPHRTNPEIGRAHV